MYFDEGFLIRLCIIGAIIGIFALYILTGNIKPNSVKISEAKNLIGQSVNIIGKISDLKQIDGNIFLKLGDESGEIEAVIWSDSAEQLELSGFDVNKIKNGVKLSITGVVEMHRGEIEILPLRSQIKVLE